MTPMDTLLADARRAGSEGSNDSCGEGVVRRLREQGWIKSGDNVPKILKETAK